MLKKVTLIFIYLFITKQKKDILTKSFVALEINITKIFENVRKIK